MMAIRRRLGFCVTVGTLFIVWSLNVTLYWSAKKVAVTNGDSDVIDQVLGKAKADGIKHEEDIVSLTNKRVSTNVMKDEHSVSIKEDMLFRKYTLTKACSDLKNPSPSSPFYVNTYLEHMLVNEEKHLLYCFVPKVANTNFRRVFLALQGRVSKDKAAQITGYDVYNTYADQFIYLNTYTPDKRQKRLKDYKKIIFVRDPLERLLSAYMNKYFHPNERLREQYFNVIRRFYTKFPGLAKKHGMRSEFVGSPITFREFLTWWTDMFQMGFEKVDEHFLPYYDLCRPCKVKYDYVGKLESLHEDVKFIFEDLGVDMDFPGKNDNYSSIPTSRLVQSYYQNLPDSLLKKVWNILKIDFTLFEYSLPMWFQDKL